MGAAKLALKFGARYGQGRGRMGQTYGLVTKNLKPGFIEKRPDGDILYEKAGLRSVTLEQIIENVKELYAHCREHPENDFIVVYKADTGQPLNGYPPSALWDCFNAHAVPDNVLMHVSFKRFMEKPNAI